MTEQTIPESRAYRHLQCGDETLVSGQSFEVVSNPMSSMEQTQCSTCGAMFPISDFAWSDTGEKLSDYYARHTQNATPAQRFLCSKTFMVIVIAGAAVLTAAAVSWLVWDMNWLARAICFAGGLGIGAFIGMALFLNVFANPITRKVCGVNDTRLLT
jgi:hypothetical protein